MDIRQDGHSKSAPHLGISSILWGNALGIGGGSHRSINNGPVLSVVETQKREQLVFPQGNQGRLPGTGGIWVSSWKMSKSLTGREWRRKMFQLEGIAHTKP